MRWRRSRPTPSKSSSAAPEQWHLFSTNWPSDEPHLRPRGREAAPQAAAPQATATETSEPPQIGEPQG